jgi:glycolate oxidase FAD binding subunit
LPAAVETLPLSDTLTPADQAELSQIVREAYADGMPIYPIGGGSSLNFGLPPREPGHGLSLQGLRRVIDYPVRDMTITVEPGITLDLLATTLAKEKQRLPIDLPDAHRATLGGIIATNTSGARRYSNGTLRDYVIGIGAVDGRGIAFHGGGRVVKNVAGYDFCKLLTGSLGTLGVITQVTLRVKPVPETSRFVSCRVRNWETAERILESLVTTQVSPAAIELLSGPSWNNDAVLGSLPDRGSTHLLVGLEGTADEVAWMCDTLWNELRRVGMAAEIVSDEHTSSLWMRLAQFPVEGNMPLVIKASVRPSRTVEFIQLLQRIDPEGSVQAHAGNGIVIAKLTQFGMGDLSTMLVTRLQPAVAECGGHIIVLSCTSAKELTHQCWWGTVGDSLAVMEEIKRQFDPRDLLNRGRFVYAGL